MAQFASHKLCTSDHVKITIGSNLYYFSLIKIALNYIHIHITGVSIVKTKNLHISFLMHLWSQSRSLEFEFEVEILFID